MLAKKGSKQVGKMTSGKNSKTVTAVLHVCLLVVPPMIIFARKNVATALTNGSTDRLYWGG